MGLPDSFILRRALLALMLLPSTLTAQQAGAVAIAQVMDGYDGSMVAGAEVRVIGTNLHGVTDSIGSIVISRVPAGRFAIEARRVGFTSAVAEINTTGTDTITIVLMIRSTAHLLPTVSVVDSAVPPQLWEFENRRRHSSGGYFIDESVIRKAESGSIGSLIETKIPGIRPSSFSPASVVKIYSTRGNTSLNNTARCQVEVFLNGVRLSDGDAGLVPLGELGGIEYFPPGFAPPQYRVPPPIGSKSGGGAACGVMLLWLRP
jgi:hypothetical protein